MRYTRRGPARRPLLALLLLAPEVLRAQVSDHPARWGRYLTMVLRKVALSPDGTTIEAMLDMTPGPLRPEAETLLIRFGDERCQRAPFLTAAAGEVLSAASPCAGTSLFSAWPRAWDIKLDSQMAATTVLRFAVPAGTRPRPPFVFVIPFHFAIAGEAARRSAIHSGIATFSWGG